MNRQISLDGKWKLRWHDSERGDRIARVLAGNADMKRAWTANVPGSVHQDLIEQGVIADPNLGTNVLSCRWVEETIWYYLRSFEAPRLVKGERAWLFFECLDLAAAVYLNGKEVGRHANAFHPCRLEITDFLSKGQNSLAVSVESGLLHAMEKPCAGMGTHAHSQLTKRPWLRKTQSEHGWDWSPRLLNVGIPGHVRIEVAKDVRWDGCAVIATLSDDLRTGTVTARAKVEGLVGKEINRKLSVKVGGQKVAVPVAIKPGANRLEASLKISDPELWWPVGHGAQPRYKVEVELEGAGSAERKVGFRKVRVNQEPHPERGRYFIVEVNGKPIFCKGGNFVPAEIILSRIDRRRYETLVDRALEANCNLLRVWGGGLYESDDLYDLCDERGVLVWQEFIFACAKYPVTDEAYLADLKLEVAHQVRRLAHHPSLVVWCGNNEMEWGNYHWGYERGVAHPDYALFHMVIPRILNEEDGSRYYQPSSPYSPNLQPPNDDYSGDQHPWSVGFGDTDFRKYRAMPCRFPNEGGILGPGSLKTVRGCTDRVGSFEWELHDNSVAYWDSKEYSPDAMIANWLGRKVGDMSIEDYVFWGGLVQGCGLAEYIKNFRRRMFHSSSAVFWMYNDVWPCVRSWTIVDYYLRRTPAFWPVRRAFAPVIVVVTRQENKVRIYGVNEGPACSGELRFGVMALAGAYPIDKTASVELPANASTMIAEFDAKGWDRLGVEKHVAFAVLSSDCREVARDALFLPLFREMHWPKAKVEMRRAAGKAVFTSKTFAWRVCIDLDGEKTLPDNFFDVYPGIPTVLEWPDKLGAPKMLRIGNG